MARKSGFVSGFDIAARVFKALANAVYDAGGDDEDVRRIESDIKLQKEVGKLFVSAKQAVGNIFKVTVDYSRSLAEMIAAGKYNWVNPDIIERHFPVNGNGKVNLNLEMAHFNRYISSDNAIVELKKMGLRPATLPEFLAFGEKYPNEQRKYLIVALGSVWRYWGVGFVPYLWGDADGRRLDLSWFGHGWRGDCRFLAVREV